MRLALFGGTFNPIHIGHLYVAEEVLVSLRYDKVVFVPAYRPAHKSISPSDDPKNRLAMVQLAVKDRSEFLVEDCEILRQSTSYTLDTIDYLYRSYSITGRIGLIIGEDLVAGFPTWKMVHELLQKVDIVIAYRTQRVPFPFPVPVQYVENLVLPISSSDIRRRVRERKAFRYLVPETVYGYIQDKGLYLYEDD